MTRKISNAAAVLLVSFAWEALASAQAPELGSEEEAAPRFVWSVEGKAHLRRSEENRFPVPFDFSEVGLPPGQPGFLETVDPGTHAEVSTITVVLEGEISSRLAARAKVDLIDLYDRNPTSGDREVDLDEAWIRFGAETEPALLPEQPGVYAKLGKIPKFERQDDRHLESYGLVSTAFNRFEDLGLEIGFDLGRHVYGKVSYTQGNPLFLRDPNALAGDNGVGSASDPHKAPRGSGIVIPYDAEVEGPDFDEPEIGAGIGFRWASPDGFRGVDGLLWGFERELAESVDLEGTFYGGDLDLLRGPWNLFPFPIEGTEKTEFGGNLWLYYDDLSLFLQYVDQELAGLSRTGFEAEVAHRFELPLVAGWRGRQLFPWVAPAVRFSRLDPGFRAPAVTPSPSFAWPWDKIDAGVRMAVVRGLEITAEYSFHEFTLGSGAERSNDELLLTLHWRTSR